MTFPEIGSGATYGATWDEALCQAEDMLEEAVLGLMAHGEDVPEPASQTNAAASGDATRRAPIALPALTAAKLEVYRAMRQAGLDEAQLATRLGWTRSRSPICSTATTPSASSSSKPRSPRSAAASW